MKTAVPFFYSCFLFLIISFQTRSQCLVTINPQGSTTFCMGDSIELVATGTASTTTTIDQQQTIYNAGTSARALAGYSYWQSFTAGITGVMTQIDIGFFNYINGTGYLTIFQGSGTAGTELDSLVVNVNCPSGNCLLPFAVNIPVTAGMVYTFQFRAGPGIPDPYGLQVENPGTYNAGQMAFVDISGTYFPGFDWVFATHVQTNSHLSYHWSTGETDTAIVVNATGTYSVTVSDSTGCSSSDTILVTMDQPMPNLSFSFDTLFSSPASSYQWYCNGFPYPGDTNSFVTPAWCVCGMWSVEITDDNGCTGFTPGFICEGVDEQSKTIVKIYPDPVENELTIIKEQLLPINDYQLSIYSILGEKMMEEKTTIANKTLVNVKSFPPGIYFVRMTNEKESIIKKFIKK